MGSVSLLSQWKRNWSQVMKWLGKKKLLSKRKHQSATSILWGEDGHHDDISIPMKKCSLVKETKRLQESSEFSSSPRRDNPNVPFREGVCGRDCLLPPSSHSPLFPQTDFTQWNQIINLMYFPVSCRAHGTAPWPSPDQTGVNWSVA